MRLGGARSQGTSPFKIQRKIFTRWVNQKLTKKGIVVDDIVNAMGDGNILIALMEVLSEKKYTGKVAKTFSMRVHKIDNISNALNFTWNCGVQMKIKPSPENLADCEEKTVLGLIWAIMYKYLKIVDDEDGSELLSAKDALLRWCQKQVVGYPEVKIDNFTNSFNNGLALCAIIHKHRPNLIDWEDVKNSNDPAKALKIAVDATERAFGFEKYLEPEDIPRLDENSMIVYISEYYYGVAEWRKLDSSVSKISKLIKTTKTNDDLKTLYVDLASKILEKIEVGINYLSDKTVDNSLTGAQQQLNKFYEFKSKEKVLMMKELLNVETLFNSLEVRLAYNQRPKYSPPEDLSMSHIKEKFQKLESLEKQKKNFLHSELNRQVKLGKLDEQHKSRSRKLMDWLKEKEEWFEGQRSIDSVGAANMQIKQLNAFEKECDRIYHTNFSKQARELNSEVKSLKKLFRKTVDYKKEVQRTTQRRMLNELSEKMADGKGEGKNLEKQIKMIYVTSGNSFALKNLGEELESELFENIDEVHEREKEIDGVFTRLIEMGKQKRPLYDGVLDKEIEKERLRMEFAS